MTVIAVYEGDTDLPVVRKLVQDAGLRLALPIDAGGKGNLDRDLHGYNDAARGSPWFVLRDLDRDAACPPAYLRQLEWQPSRFMCFRLATRAIEAWLLADREAAATFFRVPIRRIPLEPDAEPDPTDTLLSIARQSSAKRIREAMIPKPKRGRVGVLYEATIIEFGTTDWSLDRAILSSPSLRRTRDALRRLADDWATWSAGG